jgi:hypothetical protein
VSTQQLRGQLYSKKAKKKGNINEFVLYLSEDKALLYHPEGASETFVTNKCSIYIILHAIQGPGVYSTCERNVFQKQKINVSGE